MPESDPFAQWAARLARTRVPKIEAVLRRSRRTPIRVWRDASQSLPVGPALGLDVPKPACAGRARINKHLHGCAATLLRRQPIDTFPTFPPLLAPTPTPLPF